MDFNQITDYAVQNQVSDIHLIAGKAIFMRRNGVMQEVGNPVKAQFIKQIIDQALNELQKKQLEEQRQIDFLFSSSKGIRLRGNAFYTNTGLSICFRVINQDIPDFSQLEFPPFVREELLNAKNGLILVVGPTGQGKSTTVASVLTMRAQQKTEHTIMLEDPIEYLLPTGKGVTQQRQIGNDVLDFQEGLLGALRENLDNLMIGEIRDKNTMAATLTMAETGHLVIGTMHTNSSVQTIARILDTFTSEQRPQIRSQLASNLSMIISQRLLPSSDGKGRVLAFEILTMNYAIANYIRQDKIFQIPNVMQTDNSGRMIQFEQSLVSLVMNKKITPEVAYEYANDKNQLKALFELNNLS